MREIRITDDCIIYNDMDDGWITGKNQPKWHESLYKRWRNMWSRCNNPEHPKYTNYKNCIIDSKYRLLSNYVHDIMLLDNFDKLCENPSKWEIDKDIKDPNNRCYFFEHLSITSKYTNRQERNNRCGNPSPKKYIIAISTNKVFLFKSLSDVRKYKISRKVVSKCLSKEKDSYKGYEWHYINYKHNKRYRKVVK